MDATNHNQNHGAVPSTAVIAGDDRAASDAALRSCFADHKAVRRVLPLYVRDLPTQVASIQARLAEGDLVTLRRLVHGLRGSGGGYGFPDITRLATDAEVVLDQGTDPAAIDRAVDDLIQLIRRVDGYDRADERQAA